MSDVKEKAFWLLQVIEDSLQETIKHPHTLEDCLTEAGYALRILDKHVRSDDMLHAAFMVSPLCRFRFLDSVDRNHTEQMELVDKALEFVAATRVVLGAVCRPLKRHPLLQQTRDHMQIDDPVFFSQEELIDIHIGLCLLADRTEHDPEKSTAIYREWLLRLGAKALAGIPPVHRFKVEWMKLDPKMVADLHVAFRSAHMAEEAALLVAQLRQ